MFDRWQTLIASFDYINASFIFIIKACNYKLRLAKKKFTMYAKEVWTSLKGSFLCMNWKLPPLSKVSISHHNQYNN